MVDTEARRALLEAELQRLKRLREDLDGDWKKVPWLLWTTLLAVPVGALWGPIWAALTVATALSLWATAFYLIRVRREDYKHEVEDTKRELRALPK